jgi:pimeloyl-ACP methyl ester carboxylesterase
VTDPQLVLASDGVRLHAEVVDGPGPTLVLVHGFTARLGEWQLQREHLGGRHRLVLYDQRGHGASGWGSPARATLDQLADDLARVLDALAPGPVVLVGHSMGGMTVLALGRTRPDLFGERVRGAFLLATSAGDVLQGRRLGAVVRAGRRSRTLPLALRMIRLSAPAVQLLPRRWAPGSRAFVRTYLFGTDDATPELVTEVQALLAETRFTVTASFYPVFTGLDESTALPVLARVPVTVLVGDSDRLTPRSHSDLLVAGIGPSAELVVVPGAGHSVNVTRPAIVDAAIEDLVARATA